MQFRTRGAAFVLLASVGLIAACSEQDDSDGQAADTAGHAYEIDELFAFYDARYVEFDTPDQFAKSSAVGLVLRGEIVSFKEGPKLFADEPAAGEHVIMTVVPEETYKGDAATEVKVLLPQGPREVADFDATLPAGTSVALFLTEASADYRQDLGLKTESPTFWIPATPAGFIVDMAADPKVYFPLDPQIPPGENLSSALPRS